VGRVWPIPVPSKPMALVARVRHSSQIWKKKKEKERKINKLVLKLIT